MVAASQNYCSRFCNYLNELPHRIENQCERVGLPRDTVKMALINLVASVAIAALITHFSIAPIGLLTIGSVCLLASLLHSCTVSIIRHSFDTETISVFKMLLVVSTVRFVAAAIVSCFLPLILDPISILVSVLVGLLIIQLRYGLNALSRVDRSTYYLG